MLRRRYGTRGSMAAIAALALLVAACNDDPLLLPTIDASIALDLSAPDLSAPVCTTHVYEAVALASIAVEPAMPNTASTFRITIGVPLRDGCDVLGAIEVSVVGDAYDGIVIVAHRWRQIGGTCPAETTRSWPLYVNATKWELGGPHVTIRDGSPSGTRTLPVTTIFVAPNCTPTADPKCEQDCQCMSGQGCVLGACATPCAEDVDCPSTLPECVSGTCTSPTGTCGCNFGQQCNKSGVCGLMKDNTQWGAKCDCDADCGADAVCASGACRRPCVTVRDCPLVPGSIVTCSKASGCESEPGA